MTAFRPMTAEKLARLSMESSPIRRAARDTGHNSNELARRIIRRSPLGALSQPRSATPVRALTAVERREMIDAVDRETEARQRALLISGDAVYVGIVGGGLA